MYGIACSFRLGGHTDNKPRSAEVVTNDQDLLPAARERAYAAGGESLVAYYLVPASESVAPAGLRAHLRGQLREYRIPSAFVRFPSPPCTTKKAHWRRQLCLTRGFIPGASGGTNRPGVKCLPGFGGRRHTRLKAHARVQQGW